VADAHWSTCPAFTPTQGTNTQQLQVHAPLWHLHRGRGLRYPCHCRLARLPHRLDPPGCVGGTAAAPARPPRHAPGATHRRGRCAGSRGTCPGCHRPAFARRPQRPAVGRAGGDGECLRSVPTAPPWRVRRVSLACGPPRSCGGRWSDWRGRPCSRPSKWTAASSPTLVGAALLPSGQPGATWPTPVTTAARATDCPSRGEWQADAAFWTRAGRVVGAQWRRRCCL